MSTKEPRKRGGASFACPRCGSDTEVIITRRSPETGTVSRRRRCLSCEYVFPTRELLQPEAAK